MAKALRKHADPRTEKRADQDKSITIKKHKLEDLTRRVDAAERQAELAERQARSISMELAGARRRIAELESLIGGAA